MATILCIDDEPSATAVRRVLLESEGYEVIDATTGEEGMRIFHARKVDAVVVDYWMAGMNGLTLARKIKELSPNTPIVMLSGLPELPGEAVGIADRWILKGRPAEYLIEALAALTGGQTARGD